MLHKAFTSLALTLALALPLTASASDAWPTFSTKATHFTRDGKPYQIVSGAIHFQRIPRAYWKDRLKMARAMSGDPRRKSRSRPPRCLRPATCGR